MKFPKYQVRVKECIQMQAPTNSIKIRKNLMFMIQTIFIFRDFNTLQCVLMAVLQCCVIRISVGRLSVRVGRTPLVWWTPVTNVRSPLGIPTTNQSPVKVSSTKSSE